MTTTLWHRKKGTLDQTTLADPVVFDGDSFSCEATGRRRDGALMIAPLCHAQSRTAVVLVPPGLPAGVSHNGIPVRPGIFVMQHADRIDIDESTLWSSIATRPEQSTYHPDDHGRDVFCFITKARLKQSEPITICPGRPANPCGMIYKQAAWAMALEASTFKCPNCQFDPSAPAWEPPGESPPNGLDDLFSILSEQLNGGLHRPHERVAP